MFIFIHNQFILKLQYYFNEAFDYHTACAIYIIMTYLGTVIIIGYNYEILSNQINLICIHVYKDHKVKKSRFQQVLLYRRANA